MARDTRLRTPDLARGTLSNSVGLHHARVPESSALAARKYLNRREVPCMYLNENEAEQQPMDRRMLRQGTPPPPQEDSAVGTVP